MKRVKIDSSVERKLVIAMIVSKEFIARCRSALDPEYFSASHFKRIVSWCAKYYDRYKEAPQENIESIFHGWQEKGKAKEAEIEAVSDLLESLSGEYESQQLNVPFLVDMMNEFLVEKRLHQAKDNLEYALSQGDTKLGEKAILAYSSANIGSGSDVNPLADTDIWDSAYEEITDPLIKFGDKAADRFFRIALARDSLVGILAPEKRGKTWWCLEMAVRGLMNRRKVALFEVGDMSESQILRRLGTRLSARPSLKLKDDVAQLPVSIERHDQGVAVKYKPKKVKGVATAKASKQAAERFNRRHGLSPTDTHFKISTHPNTSVNVADINGILDKWMAEEQFIPDIIAIDYPDILSPEPGSSGKSTRDQINDTWKAMRRLSQERHCLVIAPTQADADSYKVRTLGPSNFSEDKRKSAHVTGIFGLNQTAEEKMKNVMRLNWIFLREGSFSITRCLNVAYCFPLGRAFCCSCF